MKYKILFLDIDGTLLSSKGEISTGTLRALLHIQQQGIPVVLASGRPYGGMLKLAKTLKLAQYGGYILCYNGAKVVDVRADKILREILMPQAQAAEVFALAEKLGLHVLTYNGSTIISQHPKHPYIMRESEITGLPIAKFDGDVSKLDFPIHKCLVVGDTEELIAAARVFTDTLGEGISAARSSPIFLEVTPTGVDKAAGVCALLDILHIPTAQAVACGDGFNDVPMLQCAGLGIAMGNAPQGVKDSADLIVAGNDENGLVEAIHHCWGDLM